MIFLILAKSMNLLMVLNVGTGKIKGENLHKFSDSCSYYDSFYGKPQLASQLSYGLDQRFANHGSRPKCGSPRLYRWVADTGGALCSPGLS